MGQAIVPMKLRRLKIPVRDYLGAVLPGLADISIQRPPELTPAAWAARNRQPQPLRLSIWLCSDAYGAGAMLQIPFSDEVFGTHRHSPYRDRSHEVRGLHHRSPARDRLGGHRQGEAESPSVFSHSRSSQSQRASSASSAAGKWRGSELTGSRRRLRDHDLRSPEPRNA